MTRCSLCGGRLNLEKRCTLCGLDNTKNDEQYKHLLNGNNHADVPLTHVHNEPSMHSYEQVRMESPRTMRQSNTSQSSSYTVADYKKKVPTYTKNFVEQYSSTARKRSESFKRKQKTAGKKAGKIVATIIAICGILSSIFGFVSEVVQEEVKVATLEATYEAYLNAGMYGVGTHIPEGTYNIEIDVGEYGSVEVLEYVDGYVNTVDYHYLDLEDEWVAEEIYLSEGQILCISEEMTAWIYSWDADQFSVDYENNPLTESFVISGKATAGIDFPEGVYDIIYSPEVDSEYGNVNIVLWNSERGQSSMEKTLYLDTYLGDTVYRNVPLTKDSIIWLQDLAQIELSPSECVGASE